MFRALPKDSGASMVESFDFFSTSVVMCLQRTQFLTRTPSPIRFLREVMPKAESGYPVVVVKHGNNICFIHRRIRNLDSHFKEFPSATFDDLSATLKHLRTKNKQSSGDCRSMVKENISWRIIPRIKTGW